MALSLEEKNETENNPAKKAANQAEVVRILEETWRQYPQNVNLISSLANAYGALAWQQLLNSQFIEAEHSAHTGINIDPSQKWIYTNLALSLLFQGKYEEAKVIYIRYKNKPFNESMDFQTAFLQDLADLEAADITHPDVEKVRALLRK